MVKSLALCTQIVSVPYLWRRLVKIRWKTRFRHAIEQNQMNWSILSIFGKQKSYLGTPKIYQYTVITFSDLKVDGFMTFFQPKTRWDHYFFNQKPNEVMICFNPKIYRVITFYGLRLDGVMAFFDRTMDGVMIFSTEKRMVMPFLTAEQWIRPTPYIGKFWMFPYINIVSGGSGMAEWPFFSSEIQDEPIFKSGIRPTSNTRCIRFECGIRHDSGLYQKRLFGIWRDRQP